MRFRTAFPLLCAAALAVMSSSPVAVEQAPAMTGYPSAGEPAIVTVVVPGAEPRRALRYVVATSTLGDLSIPLPEEAVGPGATWEARQVHVSDGVHVFQKTEFTLQSVEGLVVVLRSRLEQQAPSQLMSAADLPSGTAVRLKRLTGSGHGTITLRLDELVVSSTAELRSSAAMALTTLGRSEPMSLDLRLTLGLTPTR